MVDQYQIIQGIFNCIVNGIVLSAYFSLDSIPIKIIAAVTVPLLYVTDSDKIDENLNNSSLY